MFSIKDGAPRKLYYFTTVKKEAVDALQQKYKQQEIDEEALFWAYHKWIAEDIEFPEGKSWEELWKKLTKAQKTIAALGSFIMETNNGGVWQFLFNRTYYAVAAGEAFHEVDPYSMSDYEEVFKEFMEMIESGEYHRIREIWRDESISFEERWATFKLGAEELPTCEKIEGYFYTDEFSDRFFKKINQYIEQNLGKLIFVATKEEKPTIKKKEAIPHFTDYLTEAYGFSPEEVSIYYTGRVTIENTGTQLFLMKFKMPDGYESIGITGYFTHHFPDIPMLEIKQMYQKYHKQELVNIFHGWYLVDKELKANPKANVLNNKKWEKLLERIQQEKNSQIPVNVTFREYFKQDKTEWFLYAGDLLYNDSKDNFPKDLDNVEVLGVNSKEKGEYRGECNLLFHCEGGVKNGFGGRRAKGQAVGGKYTLYDVVGGKFKLLKDNPWGF